MTITAEVIEAAGLKVPALALTRARAFQSGTVAVLASSRSSMEALGIVGCGRGVEGVIDIQK